MSAICLWVVVNSPREGVKKGQGPGQSPGHAAVMDCR